MSEDFSRNLRLLCSYYKSIAEVCRKLEINRPQFNRYLSGRYKPSASTLRRFCEFFGVDEHEILLPHSQFERLVRVRPRGRIDAPAQVESEHLARLAGLGNAGLERYLGYYFEYYLSMARPGQLLRTLVCLEQRGEQVYYQRTERMEAHPGDRPSHNRYLGMAYFLTDRIFMVDYESLNSHEMTQTILFPSFKNRISRLTGLKIGVSDNSERMPCCARVLFEYLGPEVSVRKALALCGVYALDSPQIDASIRDAVQNDMSPGEWHFRARY
ncbi:helix-turn-helix transcriptional regulator [Marinobacterium rhizophilum]|uniref:Helix-turn-helix transcriptional regulator n=1 Tax=Marinobacterium rhizophilum TaxID=420402 RepID=A0ABY5HH75_9GAMM|nr:helix-turn-helix domain-containing protein [Marinobacterium rhizophilum]UTW11650.1 helix-turn-helix transcriptional regulator [Marinobacterium rhizophilum]